MDLYVYYIFVILCKDLYGINAVQWFLFVLSRAVHVLGAYLLYFHIVFFFLCFCVGLTGFIYRGCCEYVLFLQEGFEIICILDSFGYNVVKFGMGFA